jgi:L-malate glycosyltransferase
VPLRVLHLTPHLGGGVGKAVSGLVARSVRGEADRQHRVICFERPEKTQFVAQAEQAGIDISFCPDRTALAEAIAAADIVQLEFWNHPTTPQTLCSAPLPPMRLLVWSHVSGLHHPRLPAGLIDVADKILFTSACSFEAEEVKEWVAAGWGDRLGVVSSGGGLETLPGPDRRAGTKAGYLGSLNFSKLHPDFVSFAAAVRRDGFKIRMIGDETNRTELERQCRAMGKPELLDFRGYRPDIAAELSELGVLIYLLNPTHYGTAENALIEAMAMGIVPIVLPNAAERHIVTDRQTGLTVRSPGELAAAIDWLEAHPEERQAIGDRAAAFAREQFRHDRMEQAFSRHYEALMSVPKRTVRFATAFGDTPADWFLAFQRGAAEFRDDGSIPPADALQRHGLIERSKGSAFHFLRHFPDDPRLKRWAETLAHQE